MSEAWETPDQGHVEAASNGWPGFWGVWCTNENCFVGSIWLSEYDAQQEATRHNENTGGHHSYPTYVDMGAAAM